MKKKTPRGPEAFNGHYGTIYGNRWNRLKEALLEEPVYAEIGLPLLKPYFIDEASTLPVEALNIQPGLSVLDLCAAPGGKSLLCAVATGPLGSLIANDRSSARRGRLKTVIAQHLPENYRSAVKITGHDSRRWCLYEESLYDRVLLDAPCSSERHVVQSPPALAEWSPARPKHLARQAFSMLASALRVVKPGGILVYSTCSLEPLENDDTVAKLIKRYPEMVEIMPVHAPWGDKTKYGWIVLPDVAEGRGPIFFAKIRRRNEQ